MLLSVVYCGSLSEQVLLGLVVFQLVGLVDFIELFLLNVGLFLCSRVVNAQFQVIEPYHAQSLPIVEHQWVVQ